jgi:hypothetical protein
MPDSGEIIRRLVESGANYQTIGQALGRNRSLVRQVAIGAKPGHNLRDSLQQLERRLAGEVVDVPAPARRETARHTLARVRRPVTIKGRTGAWSASGAKKAAVRSGAKGLGHPMADAAEAGQALAVTVSVDGHLSVEAYGKSRHSRGGLRGSADFRLGDADEVWEAVRDEYAGDVTAYIADVMVERGLVDSSDTGYVREHLVDIELRAFND